MIRTFYQEDIIFRLAAILTYGISNGYSYKSIEEHVISSVLINELEKNEYDINSQIETVVESTYKISLGEKQADISFRGLFLAESYFKLFLHFKKSFEYIFLYWPLSRFIEDYGIYHEMSFSNLRVDFETRVRQTTLLKKLSLDREIKLTDVSKLAGINKNTIDKYCIDDQNLYGASFQNIYKLASLFRVKENIFISKLDVCLDQSIYLFDERYKDYRNYLGLYAVDYFDNRINEKDFTYDKEQNCFHSSNGIKLVVIATALENISVSKLNESLDENTYLVIIPSAFLGNERQLAFLEELNVFEVFVLSQEFVYMLKKRKIKEITDTVNRSLIIRASVNTLV